jgi:hypothetical protein
MRPASAPQKKGPALVGTALLVPLLLLLFLALLALCAGVVDDWLEGDGEVRK